MKVIFNPSLMEYQGEFTSSDKTNISHAEVNRQSVLKMLSLQKGMKGIAKLSLKLNPSDIST